MWRERPMADNGTFYWLLQPWPTWMLLLLAALPAVVAGVRGRHVTPWYAYGFGCALLAWPLVVVPALHALLIRPRFMSKEDRERQRRADALALIREPSVRSYPSRIKELRRPSPAGVNRRRYVYGFIKPGEALELVRECDHPRNQRAVAYYHRGVHLGYVPKRQRWVADALDDGLRLAVIVENVKMSWLSRRRARSVRTRLVVLYDGH
jgi:HIRAN domain